MIEPDAKQSTNYSGLNILCNEKNASCKITLSLLPSRVECPYLTPDNFRREFDHITLPLNEVTVENVLVAFISFRFTRLVINL